MYVEMCVKNDEAETKNIQLPCLKSKTYTSTN